jgi:hypothetical protein
MRAGSSLAVAKVRVPSIDLGPARAASAKLDVYSTTKLTFVARGRSWMTLDDDGRTRDEDRL